MPVNKDLEIIKQLEEALDIDISELEQNEEIEWDTVTYTLDAENRVNGLSLYECKVQTKHLELIGKLTSLQRLWLGRNQITQIQGLDKLASLLELGLGRNQITQIQGLDKLASLRELWLGSNQIQDATPIKDLIQKQKEQKKPVLQITDEHFIEPGQVSLGGNPLTTPPMEVVAQGNEAFLRWFEQDKLRPKTIKVCVLGNTNVGKSNLVDCLDFGDENEQQILQTIQDNYDSKSTSTHGMRIEEKNLNIDSEDFTVYFYDFGGQEYFHGTHSLFLNADIVVLVTTYENDKLPYSGKSRLIEIKLEGEEKPEKRALQHFSTDYWLDTIQNRFAFQNLKDHRDEELDRLFVVQNKIHKEKNYIKYVHPREQSYRTDLDTFSKKTKFDPLLESWANFRSKLIQEIKNKREKTRVTFSYQNLFGLLTELDRNKNKEEDFLRLEELYDKYRKKFPKDKNITEEKYKAFFIDALTTLGLTGKVHLINDKETNKENDTTDKGRSDFLDNNPNLKVFFRPLKVNQKIYEILDWNKLVKEKDRSSEKARFTIDDLKEREPTIDNYEDYLQILKNQKIIYSYTKVTPEEDKTIYVAPQYLSSYEEIDPDYKDAFEDVIKDKNWVNTLCTDQIEPSFVVKMISTFLNGRGYSPQYNQGFYLDREGLCIHRVGKEVREGKDELRIYVKKSPETTELERVEVTAWAVKEIRKLTKDKNFNFSESRRSVSIDEYIKSLDACLQGKNQLDLGFDMTKIKQQINSQNMSSKYNVEVINRGGNVQFGEHNDQNNSSQASPTDTPSKTQAEKTANPPENPKTQTKFEKVKKFLLENAVKIAISVITAILIALALAWLGI